MANEPIKQANKENSEGDRQREADSLKARAADWDGESSGALEDIVDKIIDLSSDGKATETVKEICYDLRSHPSLPRMTWVELTNILARIFINEGDWDMAKVWADQAKEELEEIEEEIESIFGEDTFSNSHLEQARVELDGMLYDIDVHNGVSWSGSEDSEDVEDGEMSD